MVAGAAIALAGLDESPSSASFVVPHRIASGDGLSLYVREYPGERQGSPIVLLTGGPGFSGDDLEPLAIRLASRRRVLLPDQRGTGRSVVNPWNPSFITTDRMVV